MQELQIPSVLFFSFFFWIRTHVKKKNTLNHESYISVDLLNTDVSMFLCLIKCEIAEGEHC